MGKYKLLIFLLAASFVFAVNGNVLAQQTKRMNQKNNKKENIVPLWNKKVRVSPKADAEQTIGLTDVTISYSRPGVKGRKIWGGLVPYNKVWRAGANEATKITFSTDVTVNGKKLPAGSYGFFVIPTPKDWTVIFNKVADQWGAFQYNEAEDAYRFKVTPQTADYHEWLEYTFSDMKVNTKGENSAVINLVWEKLKVPFTVTTDVK